MSNLEKQIKAFHKNPELASWVKRRLNMWYDLFKEPPENALSVNPEHYAALWIKPWFSREKNPPLRTFLGMLDALTRMYDSWDKSFSQRDQAYDLQLWVYDEHMMDSQLLCAAVEKTGDRKTNYFNACPEQYKFPSQKYSKFNAFNPDDFEWTSYEVRDYLFEIDDKLSEKDIRKLLSGDWHEVLYSPGTENEQKAFWHIYDFVWAGRKK